MTTFEERFYQTPYGWFRREGMTTICGGGVEGHAALKATATLDVPRVNIEPLKRSGDYLADGVSLNVASRNQARPAAISGKGRWG